MAIIPGNEKVLMVNRATNTTYGGSAALQAMQEWYTMQDIIDSVKVGPSYLIYTALITQTGTAAPTAVVLENTIGNIVWTRADTGDYRATLAGAFPLNKTGLLVGPVDFIGGAATALGEESSDNINMIALRVLDNFGNNIDGCLNKTLIEIRVYN
jgi:hypothetical protein